MSVSIEKIFTADSLAQTLNGQTASLAELSERVGPLIDLTLWHEEQLEDFGKVVGECVTRLEKVKPLEDSSASLLQDLQALRGVVMDLNREIEKLRTRVDTVGPTSASIADAWAGELKDDSKWERGQVWRWKGSLFIALKDGSGREDHPTLRNRNGQDPIWLGFVGLDRPVIAPGKLSYDAEATVLSAPATPTSHGLPGQIGYGGGYVFQCIATNQWRRFATSGTW